MLIKISMKKVELHSKMRGKSITKQNSFSCFLPWLTLKLDFKLFVKGNAKLTTMVTSRDATLRPQKL